MKELSILRDAMILNKITNKQFKEDNANSKKKQKLILQHLLRKKDISMSLMVENNLP